jgi:hypothetical protein
MNDSRETTSVIADAERLLASLTGVVSAHVVAGPEGTLREIHVLATPDLHPKQVVRNVESALSAGLGIHIDRRIVSVAQVRADALASTADLFADAGAEPARAPDAADPARTADATWGEGPRAGQRSAPVASGPIEPPRVVYLGYDAYIDAARRATCSVTLRAGPDEFTGQGRGNDTPRGRAQAAAQATFAALAACRGEDRLGLEGVDIVTAHDREFVLVAARAIDGRRPVPLTGAAHLHTTPEEAAIFASLQATNRWRVSV